MRRAKIICTLGPASENVKTLEGMVRAGMDVARLNFSHGTHDEHALRIKRLREVSRKVGKPVAILQDLQGPKIRLGRFLGGQVVVTEGAKVVLTTRSVMGTPELLPTPVRSVPRDV